MAMLHALCPRVVMNSWYGVPESLVNNEELELD